MIGAREVCWACEAEAHIRELEEEIEGLKVELRESEMDASALLGEHNELEEQANASSRDLEKAWDLIREHQALIEQFPLDDRQAVDWADLQRRTAWLGLQIGKQT